MSGQADNPLEPQPSVEPQQAPAVSSRRSFLSKNLKRAAYVAPVIWSVSARQALAATAVSGLTGPPDPE